MYCLLCPTLLIHIVFDLDLQFCLYRLCIEVSRSMAVALERLRTNVANVELWSFKLGEVIICIC